MLAASTRSFQELLPQWASDPSETMLGFVWQAYDSMRQSAPSIDPRDLERSITQLLAPRIQTAMTGYEPFYVMHGPYERETMAPPPAQPPQYDLAFVLIADEAIMWPMEAKVLETTGALADYEADVRNEFLTCRYGPFSNSGAMLAYLLTGAPADALAKIEAKLSSKLNAVAVFANRPHRVSSHVRGVPKGKAYPPIFACHHLILEYPGLKRATK